ncbi:MAG: protein-glutamate O-methyltransferase CheR [Planctomycetes bacterium]|nr:protein-glutamate O-methyltransferase CheR [Planctomycetota bacterium]
MEPLPLTPPVFSILSALVEERTGLHHGLDKRDLLAERASSRALERGLDSLLDYYYLLRYDDPDGGELQQLVEALVVQETFLFRELDQLEVAADLLAERARAAGGARAWSAACATGEEPLSLAMLLAARGALDRVELVATDVSERALARAREGRYGPRALRAAPPRALDPWVERAGDRLVVRRELIERVRWGRLNLLDAEGRRALGRFDVILCRNVLIYFADATARGVVQGLVDRLAPDGALFVGVSESLLRLRLPLECVERGGVFYYRGARP